MASTTILLVHTVALLATLCANTIRPPSPLSLSSSSTGTAEHVDEFSIRSRWNKHNLTWDIRSSKQNNTDDEYYVWTVAEAFNAWHNVSNLTFRREVLANPDIVIMFSDSDHLMFRGQGKYNCNYPFYDPSVLGHTFFSGTKGELSEIHVNNNIPWKEKGLYLYEVLQHEIGHALGLGHSSQNTSVMYPHKLGSINSNISDDDIIAIQYLYGNSQVQRSKEATTIPSATSTTTSQTPFINHKKDSQFRGSDICTIDVQKAKFAIIENCLYVFYKKRLWAWDLLSKRFVYNGVLAAKVFSCLSGKRTHKITAVYQRPNSDIVIVTQNYIFVNSRHQFRLLKSYPVSRFEDKLTGKLSAVVNTYTGKTFMFFGDHHLARQVDECTLQPLKYVYTSKAFPFIPTTVESVFRYTDGLLYFFQQNRFFAYSEFTKSIVRMGETNLSMFGIECPSKSDLDKLRDLLEKLV